MLVTCGTSREMNRNKLAGAARQAEVPTCLQIKRAELTLSSETWPAYWRPCRDFFEADRRLVHRIVQLKKAWVALLRSPGRKVRQRVFCWRYFALLHQTLSIARAEPDRGDPIPILHRIIAFESFPIGVRGSEGGAAGVFAGRNPVYLLGRLQAQAPLPTPRHVPLVLPLGQLTPFYCYRQLQLSNESGASLLVFPAVELRERRASFAPIDRLTRLISAEPDPRARRRARLLARRVLLPLVRAQSGVNPGLTARTFSILDIGAGTGHLAATAWREVRRRSGCGSLPDGALHFVDAAGPCGGRSYGISRSSDGIACAEWTTSDYRELLDDDSWLQAHGPFDWVFLCRLLCNASTISVETADDLHDDGYTKSPRAIRRRLWGRRASRRAAARQEPRPPAPHVRARSFSWPDCNPARCLAPSRQPSGAGNLRVRPVPRALRSGIAMPQLSLSDYFTAMRIVQAEDLGAASAERRYLPIRRFNPAALITSRGQSVLGQLLKASSAIVIEDPDVQPEHLVGHVGQFGLDRAAVVHFVRGPFRTKVRQYVITKPEIAAHLPGERLW